MFNTCRRLLQHRQHFVTFTIDSQMKTCAVFQFNYDYVFNSYTFDYFTSNLCTNRLSKWIRYTDVQKKIDNNYNFDFLTNSCINVTEKIGILPKNVQDCMCLLFLIMTN